VELICNIDKKFFTKEKSNEFFQIKIIEKISNRKTPKDLIDHEN